MLNGKKTLALTLVTVLAFGTALTASAATSDSINSHGRIMYEGGDGGVLIDSDDFKTIAVGLDSCNTQLINIYDKLNETFDDGDPDTPALFPADEDGPTIEQIMESKTKSFIVWPNNTIDGETNISNFLPVITSDIEVFNGVPEGTVCYDSEGNELVVVGANNGDISLGAAAWLNGSLIKGTGDGVTEAYNRGRQDALDDASESAYIETIYHEHEGNSSEVGGCYGYVKHTHTSACGPKQEANVCKCTHSYDYSTTVCPVCGHGHPHDMSGRQSCNSELGGTHTVYTHCTKELNTIGLICGKTESDIEGEIVKFNFNEP